jgi:hypothetical protein
MLCVTQCLLHLIRIRFHLNVIGSVFSSSFYFSLHLLFPHFNELINQREWPIKAAKVKN